MPPPASSNGYFATPDDAEIFEHELTYALLHQVFSFNSPVWFNVGTSSPQQVSACFILAVDDSMDSILNWYKEEGKIFQGGSGRWPQPLAHPQLEGAAQQRAHGLGPGVVHARRRRLSPAPSRAVAPPAVPRRWSCSTSTTRHRGVRRDQGQRGEQDPCPARRRVRHGPRRQGHRLGPVPERQQLGARQRRVHEGRRGWRRVRAALAPRQLRHRHRRRP